MPEYRVQLFGAPVIQRDGEDVAVDTRKALALLAYLALNGQRHHRDALAAVFWPESDSSSARAALRRTLSALNTAIAGAGIKADRDSISFEPTPDISIDVLSFLKMVDEVERHQHADVRFCDICQAALVEAVQMYHDEFMSGFTLRDSPDFDIWQYTQAESLHRQLTSSLERLVQGYTVHGDYDTAINYALHWLNVDPLHEAAHQDLMRLFTWLGDRANALRQYRECVRLLDQELGVRPLEETTRLYEAIQEGHIPAPPSEPSPVAATDLSALPAPVATQALMLPLVGRGDEWAALLAVSRQMQSGGQLVTVEGEAGIGKTRLVDAFATHLSAKRVAVLSARCYEGEANLAFAPFIQALRASLHQPSINWPHTISLHWLSETARLLPELYDLRPDLTPAPDLEGPAAESRFFEGLVQTFRAIFAGHPAGLLLIEDAQWMDSASLDLLAYLLRRLQNESWCGLLTWRSEDVPRWHRLRQLTSILPSASVITLALPRLDESAVRELVGAVDLPADLPSAEISRRLYEETEGLPFFIVEYLALIRGKEQPAAGDTWTLPASARDLLHSRLAAVSETGWQLLSTAAAIGRSFDFETLWTASGRSDEETVAALDELLDFGLVQEIGESTGRINYDFYHAKLRTLVQEETSLARCRLLHRRIAEALSGQARRGRAGALASQIAAQYEQAGRDEEAARYYVEAGEYARSLIANREAITHFQSALALGYPAAAPLHETIGDLQTLRGEYAAALHSYESAAAQSDPGDVGPLEHKIGGVYQRLGEWELADTYFKAVLAALPAADQAGQALVLADRALTAHQAGEVTRAGEQAAAALDAARQADQPQALAQAHNLLGILARNCQDTAKAEDHLRRSLDIARELDDPRACAAALNNLALVLGDSGRSPEAIECAGEALAFCRQIGDRHREAALLNNLADLYHAAKDTVNSMARLEEAVVIFAQIGVDAGDNPEIWKLTEW